MWKGKRKLLDRKNLRTSPKVAIPRWWVGEGEEEVFVEIYPNFVLVYRLGFERADKVLEELTKRQEGGERR